MTIFIYYIITLLLIYELLLILDLIYPKSIAIYLAIIINTLSTYYSSIISYVFNSSCGHVFYIIYKYITIYLINLYYVIKSS